MNVYTFTMLSCASLISSAIYGAKGDSWAKRAYGVFAFVWLILAIVNGA